MSQGDICVTFSPFLPCVLDTFLYKCRVEPPLPALESPSFICATLSPSSLPGVTEPLLHKGHTEPPHLMCHGSSPPHIKSVLFSPVSRVPSPTGVTGRLLSPVYHGTLFPTDSTFSPFLSPVHTDTPLYMDPVTPLFSSTQREAPLFMGHLKSFTSPTCHAATSTCVTLRPSCFP